tara:strand:+ start:3471 stop:3722 length:252 start_codon:yes stop_codon:yes gene_type:complete
MSKQRFIIVGRSSCPFCAMAEDFLSCKGQESIFLDYESNREILEDYKEFYKQKTVPIIISNNLETGLTKKVGGYTDLLGFLGE